MATWKSFWAPLEAVFSPATGARSDGPTLRRIWIEGVFFFIQSGSVGEFGPQIIESPFDGSPGSPEKGL